MTKENDFPPDFTNKNVAQNTQAEKKLINQHETSPNKVSLNKIWSPNNVLATYYILGRDEEGEADNREETAV